MSHISQIISALSPRGFREQHLAISADQSIPDHVIDCLRALYINNRTLGYFSGPHTGKTPICVDTLAGYIAGELKKLEPHLAELPMNSAAHGFVDSERKYFARSRR